MLTSSATSGCGKQPPYATSIRGSKGSKAHDSENELRLIHILISN